MGRLSSSRVRKRSSTGTQRGKAWGAIRNQNRRGRAFSAGELHVLTQEAFGPAPDQSAANLKKWCRRLEAAGILERVSGMRGQQIQYRLARDLGPRCPIPREEGGVFDPNSGEVLEERPLPRGGKPAAGEEASEKDGLPETARTLAAAADPETPHPEAAR